MQVALPLCPTVVCAFSPPNLQSPPPLPPQATQPHEQPPRPRIPRAALARRPAVLPPPPQTPAH